LIGHHSRWSAEGKAVHIVIMGCGRVGSTIAHILEDQGHSVAVIDQDAEAFRRLRPGFKGSKITGIGFDRDVLAEAGIEHADAFAAVSSGDNSNIISARVARETFGVRRVVARIYDQKRAEVYERLGIPTVATVPWTASRLLKSVLGESTAEAWRDPTGAVALVGVAPHEGWIGRSVIDFDAATGARTALVTRFGKGQLPTASTLIQSGDTLHVLVTDDLRPALHQLAASGPDGAGR
jgi:trk system potassium uptake protein